MDLCIIADDLTGANDSGVQCTEYGYKPWVALDMASVDKLIDNEALVINTDSRNLLASEAYDRVKMALNSVIDVSPQLVYKKLDSTLRGNIGAELDAVYEVVNPDFVVVTSAYPKNGRTISKGELFVHGTKLTDTSISPYPGVDFLSSRPIDIIHEQSQYSVSHLSQESIRSENLSELMQSLHGQGVAYLSIDAETEGELEQQIKLLSGTPFNLAWAGSAGVAQYLHHIISIEEKNKGGENLTYEEFSSALFVIGSRSEVSVQQRDSLINEVDVKAIKVDPLKLLIEERGGELYEWVRDSLSLYTALYLDVSEESIERVASYQKQYQVSAEKIAEYIAEEIGALVGYIYEYQSYEALVMTGGDMAKSVCHHLGTTAFELYYEFETGIPLGVLRGEYEPVAITKAGAFGHKETFVRLLRYLKGEEDK
ncbi:uncharacterized protein YgbK (DUF1537 family) [Salsuginibacillus halophilus]|uniref:Uncharacterized protein YgbK (DUF1537 family) n=1 Tax=Salsuginibacillus halophilus TaxID=517424 RepID=A0A2P8HHW6_9BACI|nr:four-carbon acid sugar kinase family protein [Salsuginibacillus halophilus]PSL45808.1 uncharacterized protein YgbK (DUF1537 family) [Salsuginibacillus halophilus]